MGPCGALLFGQFELDVLPKALGDPSDGHPLIDLGAPQTLRGERERINR
jgi:hypothetical protein